MHISFTVNIKLCRAYELVMLCLVSTLCTYQLEVDYMHTMYSYLFRPESAMATTTWSLSIGHIIMSTLSCHIYEGHTDQNAPLSGKYTVDYLHISPNCQYILSSISESHGSPKANFTALKEKAPKNIQ